MSYFWASILLLFYLLTRWYNHLFLELLFLFIFQCTNLSTFSVKRFKMYLES